MAEGKVQASLELKMFATRTAREPKRTLGRLVTALAARFRDEADSTKLPLFVVNQVSRASGKHVLVIWDEWKDLSGPERGGVIADAYRAAHPDDQAPVAIPIGVTAAEALTMGYLPFRIVPAVRKEDRVTAKQIIDAMRAVGGVLMQIGSERQLRFATQAQAQAAYRALATMVRPPVWTLVRETAGSNDV